MLKNVLIVVDDIEKSIEFYRDLFGLQVILKNEGNVILSEGLVLQDACPVVGIVEKIAKERICDSSIREIVYQ